MNSGGSTSRVSTSLPLTATLTTTKPNPPILLTLIQDNMKVNEVMCPALSLLNIATNNFSTTFKPPHIQSLTGGVDFSDPKVESILLPGSNSGGSEDQQSNQPLIPSIHHGNEFKFHYKSHSHHRRSTADQCPQPPVLSCSPQAETTDSCCVVKPGGVLLHTQFWDLNIGQSDVWGIHGLW